MAIELHTIKRVTGTVPALSDRVILGAIANLATPVAPAVSAAGSVTFTTNPAAAIAAAGSVTFTSTNPTGAAFATGSIVFSTSTNPANLSTIGIAGTTITFVTGTPTGNQVQIAANATLTLHALLAFLQVSSDTNLVKCTYAATDSTGTLSITAAARGSAGNSLALAASSSPNSQGTVSGGDLANGVDGDTITLAGTAVTFVASGASGNQCNVAGTVAGTVVNLLAMLQASSDTNLVKLTYATSGAGLVLNLTAAATGTGGNSLTFSTTVAGTTLSHSGNMYGGAAANTITLAGTAVTFVASGATGNQCNVAGTTGGTIANLLAMLAASSDTNLVKLTYGLDITGLILELTAAATGTGGNSLSFSTTISGTTLSNSGSMAGGLAAGANGQPATVTVSGLTLPASYSVEITPNQDAVCYPSNKTSTGFTINLNPRLASNALTTGTVDVTIAA